MEEERLVEKIQSALSDKSVNTKRLLEQLDNNCSELREEVKQKAPDIERPYIEMQKLDDESS